MTRPMIITLTPDIESGLVEQARTLGITPEQLAIDSLRERFTPPVAQVQQPKPEETLADFLSDHIGILHSNDIDPAASVCRTGAVINTQHCLSRNIGGGSRENDIDRHRPAGSPTQC